MTDFYQTPRFQLPDEWEVSETMCVKITIPADQQYYGQLIGLLDTLKWSRNFAPDPTKTGAATVSRTWQAALESAPIEVEGCDMPEFRINPDNCLLEVNCSDDPDNPDWQPVPTQGSDPRELPYPVPYPGEPPEGQTNECLAAANAAEWVWIAGGGWAGQLDGGTFAEFTVLVMGVIGGLFTLLTDIIIDHTITLFTEIEPSTIAADWAALDKQDFIDILVCYLNSDGTFPASNWGDFLSALLANTGANQAWYLVHYVMLLVGWGGINLIARIGGITEAECAECDNGVLDSFTIYHFTGTHDYTAGYWTPIGYLHSVYYEPLDITQILAYWDVDLSSYANLRMVVSSSVALGGAAGDGLSLYRESGGGGVAEIVPMPISAGDFQELNIPIALSSGVFTWYLSAKETGEHTVIVHELEFEV